MPLALSAKKLPFPVQTHIGGRPRDLVEDFKLISFAKSKSRVQPMNRQKKIKQLLKAHAKKASAKLAPRRKSTYVSKADRLKLATDTSPEPIITPEN